MTKKKLNRTQKRHRRDARFYWMGFWFCIQEIRELSLRKKLKVIFMIFTPHNNTKRTKVITEMLKTKIRK